MKKSLLVMLFVLVLVSIVAAELPPQPQVFDVTCPPKWDLTWCTCSMNLNIDTILLGKDIDIVAYKIQWFYGGWSDWYVPGVNDLYRKPGEPYNRVWACFNDHTHRYIYIQYSCDNQPVENKAPAKELN